MIKDPEVAWNVIYDYLSNARMTGFYNWDYNLLEETDKLIKELYSEDD